jgi:AraC-like DNA-binding protein
MSMLIRAEQYPAAERFERWREILHQCRQAAAEVSADNEADFRFELRTRDLGAMRVSMCIAMPYRVRRSPRLIRTSDPDRLVLGMVLRGHGTLDQRDREALVPSAEFTVYETRRPYGLGIRGTGRTGVARTLVLSFPRTLLPLPPSHLRQVTAVRMPATEGIGSLTSRLLVQLAAGMDHYSTAEAARLSTAALDVLATRLAHELDGDQWVSPDTHRRALLVRIRAFIHDHVGDPELSPATIAAAHHISLSYLHKLFHAEGITVGGMIRQRRLDACRRDLADPTLATRPAAAIAARRGFASASHFSRAFKVTYGMTPQEYRRSVRSGAQLWTDRQPLSTDGERPAGEPA